MRNPHRIDPFLRALGDVWKQHPDLRFGQLVMNLAREEGGFADTWNWEDSCWYERMQDYMDQGAVVVTGPQQHQPAAQTCWSCDEPIAEGAPYRIFNYGHALDHDGFPIHHVCETGARARLLDLLVMEGHEGREIRLEWAALARKVITAAGQELPRCGCDVCVIGVGLDIAAESRA